MTGIVFVPPFVLVAVLLLLNIFAQIANDRPESRVAPRWVPQLSANCHPCWAEYSPQALSEAAAEASRAIAQARQELFLADWFTFPAEPEPVQYLPRRELAAA